MSETDGASGGEVSALQDALHFCFGRTISIDGDFGPQTKSVLESVQRQIGVADGGVYGPTTRSHLRFVSTGGVFPGCRPVGQVCRTVASVRQDRPASATHGHTAHPRVAHRGECRTGVTPTTETVSPDPAPRRGEHPRGQRTA